MSLFRREIEEKEIKKKGKYAIWERVWWCMFRVKVDDRFRFVGVEQKAKIAWNK